MRAYRRLVVHRRVMVNLRSGRAVSGVVVAQDGPLLQLKSATVHEPGEQGGVRVDGEIVVEREQVDFIQTIASEVAP